MTRINCVPVEELSRQHLVAEYRELPRVFALAAVAFERGEKPEDMPKQYTLGTGHVRFFYARLNYVARRHWELICEMRNRNYQTNYTEPLALRLPDSWYQPWEPDAKALAINRARIKERTKL